MGVTPEKLYHAYNGFAVAQAHCDSPGRWDQLTQFVAVGEPAKLKGDAIPRAHDWLIVLTLPVGCRVGKVTIQQHERKEDQRAYVCAAVYPTEKF